MNEQPGLFDERATSERGIGDVLPGERGGGRLDTRGNVSVEWYARKQAEYREAGEASAAAWWAKKGVRYP